MDYFDRKNDEFYGCDGVGDVTAKNEYKLTTYLMEKRAKIANAFESVEENLPPALKSNSGMGAQTIVKESELQREDADLCLGGMVCMD